MVKKKDYAIEFAKKHKEVSIAEFFERNRHLLGFDTKAKALLTSIKEAVENSLDAIEDLSYQRIKDGLDPIFPEIYVEVKKIDKDIFKIVVEDNGPGILKEIAPYIFGKFLYGSKFHRLRQKRGQQGIGISAVTLYSQLTTGNPIKVESKTLSMDKPYYMKIKIDVKTNNPIVVEEGISKTFKKEHGTRVEFIILGQYISKGEKSVYEYLKRTAIANPHATIYFRDIDGKLHTFKRISNEFPPEPKEIKPHPYGIELGILQRLLKETKYKTLFDFLVKTFSGVGSKSAYLIICKAFINKNCEDIEKYKEKLSKYASLDPKKLKEEEIKKLLEAMHNTKLKKPSLDCLSPIGSKYLEEAIKKYYKPVFVYAITGKPKVYRGLPFLIEVVLAYGENIKEFKLMRFANKVPLLYDQSACAITEAVKRVNWKYYGIQAEKNSKLPVDNLLILVHLASVWVPFTSESKYAIAHYEEIINEIVNLLKEAARKYKEYLQKKKNLIIKLIRRKIFEAYAKIVSQKIYEITKENPKEIYENLMSMVEEKLKIEKAIDSIKKYGIDEEYIIKLIKKELGIKKSKNEGEE